MRVIDYISRRSTAVMVAAIIMLVFFLALLWKENRKQSEITSNGERTVTHAAAASSDVSRTATGTATATDFPGGNEEAAIQKELLRREKHEKQKKEWMKSIGMENEGTKPVDAELRAIAGTLAQYYQAYREYPQGEGKEIAAALLGRVRGQKAFLEWNQKRISPNGELLDPWGMPYFIKISGEKIELRSSGPNHVFWDADDQVLK